jgi:hypothetical protein
MLRVTTLYASSAAATAKYYTRYLTDAPGEVPGQWCGHQADRLGLTGTVSTEALELLLSGHDHISGLVLGYPLVDRTRRRCKPYAGPPARRHAVQPSITGITLPITAITPVARRNPSWQGLSEILCEVAWSERLRRDRRPTRRAGESLTAGVAVDSRS